MHLETQRLIFLARCYAEINGQNKKYRNQGQNNELNPVKTEKN